MVRSCGLTLDLPQVETETRALRERRVLAQVARGLTYKEVFTALNLSVKTVRHYLDRAFAKPGVHTRTQAAMLFAAHPGPPEFGPRSANGSLPPR